MDTFEIPTTLEEATALLEQMAGNSGLTDERSGAHTEKTPEQHIWDSQARYRALVENLPVVTFMAGLDDKVPELYVSPQIETMLGFTQQEWLDNPLLWFRQLHPDDRPVWVREFSNTCSFGTRFRLEYRLLARDGHIVWVQGDCQVIRDGNGRPKFMQGIAYDISHLKRAAQVEEEKLAAEAASRAKSEFLARMSHEIRTPLNGVVGMIDLLKQTPLNELQGRYVRLAREAATLLMSVICDILDFSKLEAGKMELESIEFDLYKAMEDLTELLGPMAARKNLTISCAIQPEVPRHVIGDPTCLRQVLTNLVNNALKFTTQGSVSVRASVVENDAMGSKVRVEVKDTGIGIPASRLERLFKSFSQVDSSTTRKFGGTGLGLAISKRLVELMDGEITVESVEGQGTTFIFVLPMKRAASASAHQEAETAEALRNVRVLAVEADANGRRVLAEQLYGRVSPASRCVLVGEALACLRQAESAGAPFDVAIVPIGQKIAQEILVAQSSGLPKVVALLESDDATDGSQIAAQGFAGRLHRPVSQSRLIGVIASAALSTLKSTSSQQPAAEARSAADELKGIRVLVAEDNDLNQFVVEEMLGRVGCMVRIVGNGKLAVEALEKENYDIVLMDCQMPEMDGWTAASHIRRNESAKGKPRIPMIALTAEASEADREKCLAAGMDGYATKPIDPPVLFETMAVAMKSRIVSQESKPAAAGVAA